MKEQKDNFPMLELIMTPAFSVRNGLVTHVNHAAQQLLIQVGTPIDELLPASSQEYRDFPGGSLYLTIRLAGNDIGASVSRIDGMDVFMLEQEQTELRTLALAAQNLRLPLADVINLTDRISSQLEGQDAQSQLSQINRKLSQLKRLILNMADASRYTSATAPQLPVVDACAFVRERFGHIAVQAEAAGFHLHTEVPAASILCRLDEEKLERAIYNLISNAMKVSQAGDTIEATLSHRGKSLYLSVRDSGSGIPDAVMGSIFTRYQRQPGLDSSQSGLGLGMVMVRTAAAVHGGTVLVTQPPEGGTQVILSIPIRTGNSTDTCSDRMRIDYAGEKDHGLLELSDVLPPSLYADKD